MTKTVRKKRNAAEIAMRVLKEASVQSLLTQELEDRRWSISPAVAKKAECESLPELSTDTLDREAMCMMLGYAKTSQLMKRWQVDRQTARAAVCRAGVMPSKIHRSPHFSWFDVLEKIEGWPPKVIARIDTATSLHCTSDLADLLSVSFPTVRNYGKSGRLHEVRLGKRTLRYAFPDDLLDQSEEKTVGYGKK